MDMVIELTIHVRGYKRVAKVRERQYISRDEK